MNQRTLDGSEIFPAIIVELEKSKHEILVVSAWFTDDDLFSILLKKQKQGVKVKVIIAENDINEKIDFSELELAGGVVYKIENNGYGMMHKKYCIIDEKVAIHGSYNWTNNARKSNQESVIMTEHKDTIQELKIGFNKMEENLTGTVVENTKKSKVNQIKNNFINFFSKKKIETEKNEEIANTDKQSSNNNEIVKNIDDDFATIISTEIKNIDRDEIRTIGKNSALKVNGDEGVLGKSMDSLYQVFISDINQVSEKKETVKNKIDIKKEELIANYEIDSNNDKELENTINLANENELKRQLNDLEGRKKLNANKGENIENNIISGLKQKVSSIKEEIANFQVEFVKPKIKYFELIPKLLILFGLGAALFLFYSSSAYIMLYAKDDAMEMLKNGLVPITQVFNSQAFILSGLKNGTAVFYITSFVFIPLAIAFATHKAKLLGKIGGVIAVILLDAFVAYKVSDTINEINYLSNGITNNDAFYMDHNLWIVFLLSAMPFIFFMVLLDSTLKIFEARHPQSGKEKMEFQVNNHKEKIRMIEIQIKEKQEEKQTILEEILSNDNEMNNLNIQLSNLNIEYQQKIKMIEENCNGKIRLIKSSSDVYKNNIDNDNIPISHSALRDRVSSFLEGWNEWLHEEFSVIRAVKYSENARVEADSWLSNNINTEKTLYTLKKAS